MFKFFSQFPSHKNLSAAADDEIADLRQDLDSTGQKLSTQIVSLNSALDSQSKSIQLEISQVKDNFQNDLSNLQKSLLEELEKHYGNLLEEKLSKDEIAELFFDFCMKLKGKNYIQESDSNRTTQQNGELLLPESDNRHLE